MIPPNTPIMIGETGSVEHGGSKAAWIQDALTVQLPANFPRIKALIWFDMSDGAINLEVDTSPAALAAFQHAIALPAYQANRYADLNQAPIPPPEQVALPPPPSTPAATGGTTTGEQPGVQRVLGGAAPGTIELVNAADGAPVAGATLGYVDGTLATTDHNGDARVPVPAPSAPQAASGGAVLDQLIIGATVIPIELAVDAQYGYEVLVDRSTGKIAQILVNVILFLVPIFLQAGLLAALIAILLSRATRGTRRGRTRRQAKAQPVTQTTPAMRTLADMPQRQPVRPHAY